MLSVNARAGIGYKNLESRARFARSDGHAGAVLGVLERVVDEIGENPVQGALVAQSLGEVVGNFDGKSDASRRRAPGKGCSCFFTKRGEIERLWGEPELLGLDLR